MKGRIKATIAATCIIVFACLLAIGSTPVLGNPGADFSFQSDTWERVVGEIFTVDIKVDASTQPVDAAQAYVNFDPNYLRVVDEDGNEVNEIMNGELYPATWPDVMTNEVRNSDGEIDYAAGKGTTGSSATTLFTLATIRFKAIAETDGTSLTFNIEVPRNTKATHGLDTVTGTLTSAAITITALPVLCTSPDPPSHDFGDVPEGETRSWSFDITNCGTGTLTWNVGDDQPWIIVSPASGSTTTETDTVTVTIDTTGLECCIAHNGTVTITSDDGTKTGTITVHVPCIVNHPPVADAGPDQTVYVIPPATTAVVTLDGSGSYDPDGDPLIYTWTWDGNIAHGVSPTVELPLGTTTITLVVYDGELNSDPDTVDITVEQVAIPAVGGEAYPINRIAVLAPWIGLIAAIIAGATITWRRRRAQS